MIDSRLAVSVEHADGTITRWAPDEVDAANVLGSLRFGTTIPGGYKDLSCGLLRDAVTTYYDQVLFDTVRAYGPGNQTAWEGRMVQFPRSHGAGFQITPGAVGWSAHLRDDPSFSMVYVDRDVSRWTSPSGPRRAALLDGGGWNVYDPRVDDDASNNVPSLVTTLRGAWGRKALCEASYDAGPGNLIDGIYYDFHPEAAITPADTNWAWFVAVASDNVGSVADYSANLRAASGAGTFSAPTVARRFGVLTLQYGTAAGTDGLDYDLRWRNIAVYGDHGITRRGPSPGGLYASNVIADIVRRAAPLLTFSQGPGGSLEDTSFAIPHLVFLDPVTAEDAILATNAFNLYEWGVYDDREFFYRAPDPSRLTWQARLDEGAQFAIDGLSADEIYNGVFVRYQDPAGTTHTVGPPGSRAEATSVSLADTREENPVNAHGIPRRWAKLDLSQTTTLAGATQIGAVFLAERALASRKGSMTVTGTVRHPTKGPRPVWEVRAGDYVEIPDHPDTAPRRVIETSYDHDQRTNILSLDSSVDKLTAILERFGASLTGVI